MVTSAFKQKKQQQRGDIIDAKMWRPKPDSVITHAASIFKMFVDLNRRVMTDLRNLQDSDQAV